ncbi:MAG: SRPBCC family protein [Ignavibacteriales bacterium]|nr:SRPBCC family protein [Ignavibacteriales bacterium]
MITLLRREFTVEVGREKAWNHLARVEEWPSWASHIKRIEVATTGEIGPTSRGIIRLRNGVKSEFTMSEFNPYFNWKWKGAFLWLTIHYDHLFEAINDNQTRLVWVVEGEGFSVSFLGKLFAFIYNRNLNKAIPRLVDEMNASVRTVSP